MSDELIASGSAIVATEVPLVIPHVDEPPQLTPELQAEVDRLAKVKAQQLKREDFEDYDSLVEAVVDYKADLKIAKWREDDGKRTGQEEYQKKITALAEKLDEGYTLYPDFEEVAKDQSVPIT